ncbi:MAG: RidA family protein [Pseudomonadota bacterium]
MTSPEDRLAGLGLALPAPVKEPPGVTLPFAVVNVRGDRAFISGHPAQGPDGSVIGPYGVLGADMTTEEGHAAARQTGLSILANLRAEIGSLSRVAGWGRVFAMVASSPGYTEQHLVANGFSDLIVEVFGPDIGRHSRSAVGVAALPLGFALEIEAEVLLRP